MEDYTTNNTTTNDTSNGGHDGSSSSDDDDPLLKWQEADKEKKANESIVQGDNMGLNTSSNNNDDGGDDGDDEEMITTAVFGNREGNRNASNKSDSIASGKSDSTWRLYVSHGCTAWTLRMWEFAVALLLIAMRPNSVLLPAIYALALALSVMLFNPLMGRFVDTMGRFTVAKWSLVMTKAPFALSSLFVYLVLTGTFSEDGKAVLYWGSIVLVILLTCCGHVSYNCNKLSVEKDWVTTIFKTRMHKLATINSNLRRIDLTCKLVAPMCAGFIMTYSSQSTGALVICVWNIVSFFPESTLLSLFYNAFPVLATPKPRRDNGFQGKNAFKHHVLSVFYTFGEGWQAFRGSDVFRPGLSLSLLYSTVLCMGPILTAYAFYRGMSEALLGSIGAVGSIFGILATFAFPKLVERFGLLRTGLMSIWCMILTITMCLAAAVISQPEDGDCSNVQEDMKHACISNMRLEMGLLMTGVSVARLGLWLFDLSVTQELQEWVPSSQIGIVSGSQVSLNSFFGIVPPIFGIVFSHPTEFDVLTILSFSCVSLAGLIYTSFYAAVRDGSVTLAAQEHARSEHAANENSDDEEHNSGVITTSTTRKQKKPKKKKGGSTKSSAMLKERKELLLSSENTSTQRLGAFDDSDEYDSDSHDGNDDTTKLLRS